MDFFNRIFFVAVTLFFLSCGPESDKSNETGNEALSGEIAFFEGWVRPGSQAKMSAAYLTIMNGTAKSDTLIGVFTEAARLAEVHESYEDNQGIMGMRPAEKQMIKPGGRMEFKPGKLHIMLMELNRDLAPGDSVKLTFEFARAGTKTITLPVEK